jgi:hypothetical protein
MGARRRRRICIGCELGPGVEYNYYDFGSANINENATCFCGGSISSYTDHNLDLTVQTVTARLTYKFGGYGKSPVMAKY